MRRPLMCLLSLLALLAAGALTACGGDDDESAAQGSDRPSGAATEEPSPSEQREALEDTTARPVVPRPSGSPPRRLVKEDVVRGKGRPARPGDTLTVHYVGVLFSTGKEFDASWDRGEPIDLRLGAGTAVRGWDEGLAGIRKGGRRVLTIPPELAYGAEGHAPAIGPNETLVYVFDAIDVD